MADPTPRRGHRKSTRQGADADRDWSLMCAWLPPGLDAMARTHRAFERARVVPDAATLLRLVLLYASTLHSLMTTAAWAARALGLELSGSALAYRFRQMPAFLSALTTAVLAARLRAPPCEGVALRIVDATCIAGPGATATEWRVHLTYDPRAGVTGVELTDEHGGEALRRAAARRGDLVMADRGYGYARDLRAARAAGWDCLVRCHLQSLAVRDTAGHALTPEALMAAADAGLVDQDVRLPQAGQPTVTARLLVVPLPPEAAGRARQKLRRVASKKGHRADATALALAGYFCALTTLDRARASLEALCRWYRVRWQVELFFKRARQMLDLGRIAGSDALEQAQLWAQVLLAALAEWGAVGLREVPRVGTRRAPVSPWRAFAIVTLELVRSLVGHVALSITAAAAEATRGRLRDRPRRRRRYADETLDELLGALNAPQTLARAA